MNTSPHRSRRSLILALALAAAVLASATAFAQAGAAPAPAKSLYDRLGGVMAISMVVNDFIDALVPDAQLNMNPAIKEARARVPAPYLKFHVTSMVCQATGGPCQYTGRGMKESHAHLHITPAEWDRMVTIFKGILDKYKVPAKEQGELIAIVGSTRADIVEEKK